MAAQVAAHDLTSRDYWKDFWDHCPTRRIDPAHHFDRELIRVFDEVAAAFGSRPCKLLEVGCGDSMWLPFLAKRHGWSAHGIDYSAQGCQRASRNLLAEGVPGEIEERDLFQENSDLHGRFEVVYSGGLVEHFGEPVDVVRRMATFLRPGGLLVTEIPNLLHPGMLVQKLVGPKVLATHYAISLSRLRQIHEQAGIHTLRARYLGLGVTIVPDWHKGAAASPSAQPPRRTMAQRAFGGAFFVASRTARLARSACNRLRLRVPANRWLSPALVYVGRVPESTSATKQANGK